MTAQKRTIKKTIIKTIILSALVLLHPVLFLTGAFDQNYVYSGSLTNFSDTMTRLKISEESSHDFTFDLDSGSTYDSGEDMTLDFDEDGGNFTVDGANDAIADYAVTIDKGSSPTAMTIVGVDGDCTGHGSAHDIAVLANDTSGVITFTACGSFTASDSGATIRIQIGTAAGGTNRITNPGSAGTYSIPITVAPGSENDTGTPNVPILTDDQVVVSAEVDPSLTVTLSSNTCSLGTLSTSTIETCNYNIDVSTNSSNGYKATIIEDGNLRSSAGDDIDDESGDSTINSATEEYGVATSSSYSGNDIVTYTNCNDPAADGQEADAITGTAQQFAGADDPVTNEVTTLCHAAAIASTTQAGSYEHIVTLIVTALY